METKRYGREEKQLAVEAYLNAEATVSEIAAMYEVSYQAVCEWIRQYKSIGEEAFKKRRYTSYPVELKQQAVKDYLSGKGSYAYLSSKYKILSPELLRTWVRMYNNHIEFKPVKEKKKRYMAKGRKTTLEERIAIVEDYLGSGSTYVEVAKKHNVAYHQVNQWVKKYREHGVKGLEDKRGQHIPAGEKELTEADILRAELKIEKKKNRELEVEIAVLKKLKELERRGH